MTVKLQKPSHQWGSNMSFKNRLLSHYPSTNDGTQQYAENTDSVLMIYSLVSEKEVHFKAFITDLSDNFKSSWNSEEVFGRMDPMGTFKNTKRTISVGWDVPSANLEEAISNMEAVRTLTSMLYPGYSGNPVTQGDGETFTTANSISRSPLVRVKFANLIYNGADADVAGWAGLLGWIDGINIQPQIDVGFFIDNKKHYPKTYKLSFNLNVLHETDLGFNEDNKWMAINKPKWPFGGQDELVDIETEEKQLMMFIRMMSFLKIEELLLLNNTQHQNLKNQHKNNLTRLYLLNTIMFPEKDFLNLHRNIMEIINIGI